MPPATEAQPTERTRLLPPNGHANESGKPQTQPSAADKSFAQKAVIVCALVTGFCVFALDASIVSTLAPTIGSAFGKAESATSLGSFFLAGGAAVAPIWGKLSNIFGRRAVLLSAGTIFGVATAGCAVANSMELLLACRLIAGMGGSALFSTGQIVLADLVSQRQRGRLQGIGQGFYAVAFSLGGPVGGALNARFGWRGAFSLQLPIIVVVLIAYAVFVDIPLPFHAGLTKWERIKAIDWAGSLVVMISIFCLIGGLQAGGVLYNWSSWQVIALMLAGVAGLGLFYWIEARFAEQPIIATNVLRKRTVIWTSTANILQAYIVFSTLYLLPYYYLVVLDLTPAQSGIRFTPQSLGLAVGSFTGGAFITWTGRYQPALVVWSLVMLVSPLLVATTWVPNAEIWPSSYYAYFCHLVPLGFGNGAAVPGLVSANLAAVTYEEMASVASINSFSRTFGQVLGVTLGSAFVQESVRVRLIAALGDRPDAAHWVRTIRGNVAAIRNLPADIKAIALEAYKQSLQAQFWIATGAAAAAVVACALVPQHHLSKKAPARQDEDDEDGTEQHVRNR